LLRKSGGLGFRVFGVSKSLGLRVFVLEVFVLETHAIKEEKEFLIP